ncbi:Uncharacterised protein [Campylobacter jejuni]|nr:Uncharacterised protein [Campylobacter jejuni]
MKQVFPMYLLILCRIARACEAHLSYQFIDLQILGWLGQCEQCIAQSHWDEIQVCRGQCQ